MIWLLEPVQANSDFNPIPAKSSVKIMGSTHDGKMLLGSGVVIAGNRVVTNCHVTRFARTISALQGPMRFEAVAQTANPQLDLCILHFETLTLPAIPLGNPQTSKSGDKVYAYGYPNGIGLSFRQGKIKDMHPFRGSYVIEIDIGIKQGASGGGLFNSRGELIGLTTFYRNDHGGRYYAIPVDWLNKLQLQDAVPISRLSGKAFWQAGIPFTRRREH